MKFVKLNAGYFVIALGCLVFMAAEMVNCRFWMNDFTVYYHAAFNVKYGDHLYKIWYQQQGYHYIYKYSPLAAVYFIPFTVMPLLWARISYWLFLTLVIVSGFALATRLFANTTAIRNSSWLMVLAAIPLAVHFIRELHLGQVNFLLVVIYMLAALLYVKNKTIQAVILLAASVYIKPFALIFLPCFLLRKDLKAVTVFVIALLVLFFVPLLFYPSLSEFTRLYKDWINELSTELSHKQDLFAPGNQTVFSVLARYTPLGIWLNNGTSVLILQLVVISITGILYFLFVKKSKGTPDATAFDLAYLCCLIPLFSFTSENAFCFTCFAITGIVLSFNNLKTADKFIALLAFVFIGCSSAAIIGSALSNYLDSVSVITLGTLMLLYILTVLRKEAAGTNYKPV